MLVSARIKIFAVIVNIIAVAAVVVVVIVDVTHYQTVLIIWYVRSDGANDGADKDSCW